MGTRKQKIDLASSALGIDARVVKELLNANRNTLPCIYFFTLGLVKDLRASMDIDPKYPDTATLGRFGFTKELARRTGEHMNKYNKIEHVDLKLKHYSYIDPLYMSSVEVDIKEYMMGFHAIIKHGTEEELVIVPEEHAEGVKKQYELIGKRYMGHISEVVNRIKELEQKNANQLLEHRVELSEAMHRNMMKDKELEMKDMALGLKDKDIGMKDKDLELKDKDIALKDREIELLRYKIKMMETHGCPAINNAIHLSEPVEPLEQPDPDKPNDRKIIVRKKTKKRT
jgi:dynactin complex subunit